MSEVIHQEMASSSLQVWWESCKQHGVELIESGDVLPVSQPDFFDVNLVRTEEEQITSQRGGCSRCDDSEIIERTNCQGFTRRICKWTFKPCQRQRLADILNLYGRAFE